MIEQEQATVKEILTELLAGIGIESQIETRLQDSVVIFNVRTNDSGILIGQHGVSLSALQYLVRVLAAKKLGRPVHFVVDVEDYKKSREEFLKELARQAADRVRQTREALLLKPMMAYERRIVHETISAYSDIMTESQGEDPERRVLIKPRGLDEL